LLAASEPNRVGAERARIESRALANNEHAMCIVQRLQHRDTAVCLIVANTTIPPRTEFYSLSRRVVMSPFQPANFAILLP
jgi:hypothetical protein